MSVASWLEAVVELSEEAGRVIMNVYDQPGAASVRIKEDDSPLTLADRASNDVIVAGLQQLTPDIPIVSEENKQIEHAVRQGFPRFWMVDPLDGTKEFINRNGEFTVNIALIEGQSPIMGVVHVPATGNTYTAVKGQGAFKLSHGIRVKLEAPVCDLKGQGLRVVCSRSHLNTRTQEFLSKLNDPQLVATGSSLKFILIAEGSAELYPRLGPTMEWDTAAAHIVLEEAGGRVLEEDFKTPLLYNKESLLNPHFMATGKMC